MKRNAYAYAGITAGMRMIADCDKRISQTDSRFCIWERF